MQIGNFDIGGYGATSDQADPRMTFDVTKILSKIRPGIETAWQVSYTEPLNSIVGGLTNFAWINRRFQLATDNKSASWTYGAFLLFEEDWNPASRSNWPGGNESLSNWIIEGSATFAGIEVKLLKTWYIASKGAWNQSWWDTVKVSSSGWLNSTVVEWTSYYYSRLLDAWHAHMHNLGKKSSFHGIVGIVKQPIPNLPPGEVSSGMYYFDKIDVFPPPCQLSVLKYDLLIAYQYPTCISCTLTDQEHRPIAQSIDVASKLRSKYNYKGKVVWILTSLFPDNVGSDDINIQDAEYKALMPYVDTIIVMPLANMVTLTNPNPPRLLQIYEKYNTVCNPSVCDFTISY